VVVKVHDTAIALLAVLGVLEDVSLTNVAIVLVGVDIEAHNVVAFYLCLSFQIDCSVCWVDYRTLECIHYYED